MTRRQPADAGRAGPLPRTRGDDLESDDIELIVDTLNAELTPWVLRYAGMGDEPLVRIAISKGDNPDAQSERETDRMLFDIGFPLTKEDLSERYGRPLPEGAEEVLAGRKKAEASRAGAREDLEDGEVEGGSEEVQDGGEAGDELANAAAAAEAERTGERPDQPGFLAAAADQLCRAQLVDYRDELAALARVATTNDPVLARATLRRVSAKLGGRRSLPLASATAWAAVLASSLVNGWAVEDVADDSLAEIGNAARHNPQPKDPRDGRFVAGSLPLRGTAWKKTNRPQGTGAPKKPQQRDTIENVIEEAFADPDSRAFVEYEEIDDAEAAAIQQRTGSGESLRGVKRTLSADTINKVMDKHSSDHRPVTEDDLRRLSTLLHQAVAQRWDTSINPNRLISVVNDGGRLKIVEEVRQGKGRLAVVTLYRA